MILNVVKFSDDASVTATGCEIIERDGITVRVAIVEDIGSFIAFPVERPVPAVIGDVPYAEGI